MVMIKVAQLGGEEHAIDGWMKSNLDDLKKAVELDWDGVLLYTGDEGDGKSTKCAQDLAYLDPTFNLHRVCGTLAQIKELLPTLKPGQAIQYDESRKDTNTADNVATQREFIRIMTENRDKRLYWGIVSATFFDLKKYFAIHRTRVLINVYSNKMERGYFSFYDREKKKELYIKGRKDWNWSVVSPNFRGRFGKWLPYDAEAYKEKKKSFTIGKSAESTNDLLSDPAVIRGFHKRLAGYIEFLHRNQMIKDRRSFFTSSAEYFGMSVKNLYNLRQEALNDTKKEPIEDDLLDIQPAQHTGNDNYYLVETRVLDHKREEEDL